MSAAGPTTEGAALSVPASEPASRRVILWWHLGVLVVWGAFAVASPWTAAMAAEPSSPGQALASQHGTTDLCLPIRHEDVSVGRVDIAPRSFPYDARNRMIVGYPQVIAGTVEY